MVSPLARLPWQLTQLSPVSWQCNPKTHLQLPMACKQNARAGWVSEQMRLTTQETRLCRFFWTWLAQLVPFRAWTNLGSKHGQVGGGG